MPVDLEEGRIIVFIGVFAMVEDEVVLDENTKSYFQTVER